MNSVDQLSPEDVQFVNYLVRCGQEKVICSFSTVDRAVLDYEISSRSEGVFERDARVRRGVPGRRSFLRSKMS